MLGVTSSVMLALAECHLNPLPKIKAACMCVVKMQIYILLFHINMALLKANLGQKGCLEAVALLPQDWLKYVDVLFMTCFHAWNKGVHAYRIGTLCCQMGWISFPVYMIWKMCEMPLCMHEIEGRKGLECFKIDTCILQLMDWCDIKVGLEKTMKRQL